MKDFRPPKMFSKNIDRELSKTGLRMFLRLLVMILCQFEVSRKHPKKRGGQKKKNRHNFMKSNVRKLYSSENECLKCFIKSERFQNFISERGGARNPMMH